MEDQFYRCRYLLPVTSPPIEDAWIWTRNHKIKAFGSKRTVPSPSPPVEDLGDTVVIPGFINAHCHLELGRAEGLRPNGAFVEWIQSLMHAKVAWTTQDAETGIARAYTHLRQSGVVAIADHTSWDAPLEALLSLPVRGRMFIEVLGVSPAAAEVTLSQAKSRMQALSCPSRWSMSVSPHSVHALAGDTLRRLSSEGDFFSIHVGESREEEQYFQTGEGPLARFIALRGGSENPRAHTQVEALACAGYLGKRLLLVHGNTLSQEDLARLDPKRHCFVHCPGSHLYFGHPPFPLERVEACGFRVALGTDSWASNASQDFLRELRLFRETYPSESPTALIRRATLVGAEALGMDAEIGSIETGKAAEFIGFPYHGGDPHLAVLNASEVSWSTSNYF